MASVKGEKRVAEVIQHVLNQVFGTEATHLIYRHLEANYALKPEEIVDRIDVFAKGLEEFLSSGAYVVERKIIEDIYSSYGLLRRLELERNQPAADFADQIRTLMRRA
jgi:hypothetical protein